MNYQHLEPRALVDKFGGRDVAQQIALIFLEEAPPLLREFRAAGGQDPDLDRLRDFAHQLKGSLGMMGADELTNCASLLLDDCLSRDICSVQLRHQHLLSGINALLAEVEQFLQTRA